LRSIVPVSSIRAVREEFGHGYRVTFVSSCSVYYRTEGQTLLVLRVLHTSRDVERVKFE